MNKYYIKVVRRGIHFACGPSTILQILRRTIPHNLAISTIKRGIVTETAFLGSGGSGVTIEHQLPGHDYAFLG